MSYNNQYPQQPPQAHYGGGGYGGPIPGDGKGPQQYGYPQQPGYGPPQGGYHGAPPQGMPYGQPGGQPMYYGQQPPMMYGQPQQVYVQPNRPADNGMGCCTVILAALACCCCLEAIF
ncbi:hypothetical protein JCM10049v2_005492 [Rhodotorula toruloides]